MKAALGVFLHTPTVRRSRAVNAVLMTMSLITHDGITRTTDGRGLDLDALARELRNLAEQVDAIEVVALGDIYKLTDLGMAA
jgi:hypothetical protein